MSVAIVVESEARMLALGEAVGRAAAAGDVVGLYGDLGAGKTVFVKGLARGLGVPPSVPVTSPTFTLVNDYRGGRLRLFHVDLYRLEREAELEDVGLDDLYREGQVVAVEWLDRFPGHAPGDRLDVRISTLSADERRLEAHAGGPAARRLEEALEEAARR